MILLPAQLAGLVCTLQLHVACVLWIRQIRTGLGVDKQIDTAGKSAISKAAGALVGRFAPAHYGFRICRSAEIVEKFKPELVYWLLLAGLAADVLFYFFWIGTAVRLLVDEQG
jgi:hypothetical protein